MQAGGRHRPVPQAMPNGSCAWRIMRCFRGKEEWPSVDVHPETSLKEARGGEISSDYNRGLAIVLMKKSSWPG